MKLFNKKPKLSPLGTAIETVRQGIEFARRSGVLGSNRILLACEVVLDHLHWCHIAIRAAVDVVNILEDPKADTAKVGPALQAFKAAAIRARMPQVVGDTQTMH